MSRLRDSSVGGAASDATGAPRTPPSVAHRSTRYNPFFSSSRLVNSLKNTATSTTTSILFGEVGEGVSQWKSIGAQAATTMVMMIRGWYSNRVSTTVRC